MSQSITIIRVLRLQFEGEKGGGKEEIRRRIETFTNYVPV
jgi:hypothetical protein